MWNQAYSNRICNFREKIREQSMHLERLFTIKPIIDSREPYQPAFLKTQACKEQIEEDKRIIVDYENRVLKGKLHEVSVKPSQYNLIILSPKHYPAFDKRKEEYKTLKKNYDIYQSNVKLYKRISALKSSIKAKELLKCSKKASEYKDRISNSKNYQNPCLKFETIEDFKRKIEIQLATELMLEETRPKTAYTNSCKKKTINTKIQTQSTNPPTTTL